MLSNSLQLIGDGAQLDGHVCEALAIPSLHHAVGGKDDGKVATAKVAYRISPKCRATLRDVARQPKKRKRLSGRFL